jgi:hypothetical protein
MVSVSSTRARLARFSSDDDEQLLLAAMILRSKLGREQLNLGKDTFVNGAEVAEAVRVGQIDCGVVTEVVARSVGLDFIPLVWEHFDLAFRQRDYFKPGPQAFLKFLNSSQFKQRAIELGGYDISSAGEIRAVPGTVGTPGGPTAVHIEKPARVRALKPR